MRTSEKLITGIHHVTAIASDPQANVDFYVGLLGLRLVKKTVNFDDPSAYHFYYGDESGSAGTIVTFFYWPGHAARGRIGSGQSTALVFSASPDSLGYWEERLRANSVPFERVRRFGEETLQFSDPDHIPIEIVAVAEDKRTGWTGSDVPPQHAIRGLHLAELSLADSEPTQQLLTEIMGFREIRSEEGRIRLEAGNGASGNLVDLVVEPTIATGRGGSGTIHHVAWNVPDDASELRMQKLLRESGFRVSGVRNRDYFQSIYYPSPGGVLFEIATATPGFTIDEPLEELGTALQLPEQFAQQRSAIEAALPPVEEAKKARPVSAQPAKGGSE